MEILIVAAVVSIISTIIGYFIANKINNAKLDVYIQEAKAKANVIEHEAQLLLNEARIKAQKEYESEFKNARRELEKKENELNLLIDSKILKIKKMSRLLKILKLRFRLYKKVWKTKKNIMKRKMKKQ